MSQLRYVPGNTPAEREPQLWDTIRSLEAKLVIAEYEAREKISARQDVRESLLQRAIRIAENALDAHSCTCSRCKEDLQNLNNLKCELLHEPITEKTKRIQHLEDCHSKHIQAFVKAINPDQ